MTTQRLKNSTAQKYHIDGATFSLQQLAASLQHRQLIPSRMPLKDNLEQNFEKLTQAGLNTLEQLCSALKSKPKLQALAHATGIDEHYLTLLKREANSYFPNPIALNKFPQVDERALARLKEHGIANSKQLFEKTRSAAECQTLRQKTGLSDMQLQELIHLADLARLYGVGPVFARLLCDSGINSVERFVELGAQGIIKVYEDHYKKKADFGEADIAFALEIAKEFS